MKRNTARVFPRIALDFGIILAIGALCFLTTYWLINKDFALIYGACFVYTAVAAWGVATSWVKNIIVSLSVLLFSLLIAEMVLSVIGPSNAVGYTRGYSQPLRENRGELGYRPYAARKVRAWKTVGNERAYDVVYTINKDGFRQTPGIEESKGDKAPIVFFGGSYAFGEGLNDDETLPYLVAAETNWSRPTLNLAFSGYGTHQMLRSLELGSIRDLGYQSIDVVVYVAIPDHAGRSAGEAWWDPVGPRYELDGMGNVQYRGRFHDIPDAFSTAYYPYLKAVKMARRSRVLDRAVNLFFPATVSEPEENAKLMVEIVAKSSAILEADYQAELVVLLWDNQTPISTLILDGLVEKNIRTIKVSDIIPLSEQSAYQIPNDPHPTAAANEWIARELVKTLELLD